MCLKIKNLHLTSYGKFKDCSLDLSEGLNIVAGDNEAGKSTVMSFIRAMMFGFEPSKGNAKSGRVKYTPWSGEKLAGEMTFTHDGKTYRISRIGGKTKASDKVSVLDLETGMETDISISDMLTVGEEGYTQTAFIRQLGSGFRGSNEITSRLLNLSESGSEDASVEESLRHLENMHHLLKHKKGTGGAIDTTEAELSQLYHALRLAKERHAEEAGREAEKKELERRLAEIEPKLTLLSAQMEDMEKSALYKEYYASQADEERLEKRLAEAISEQEKNERSIEEYQAFQAAFPAPNEESTETIDWELERLSKQKESNRFLVVAGGVLVALFGGLGFWKQLLFFGILAGAAALCVGILRERSVSGEIDKFQKRKAEKEAKNKERSDLLASFGCESVEEYNEKRAKGKEYLARRDWLAQNVAEAERDAKAAGELRRQAEDSIRSKFGEVEDYTPLPVNGSTIAEKSALEEEKIDLTKRLAILSATTEEYETVSEAEEALAQAEAKLDNYRKKEEALRLAMDALSFAHEELSRDFAPRLNRRASEILDALTGGTHAEILMTKDFDVSLHDGAMHEVDYFSNGTTDQVYFALRLALSELMFEGKDVPIILDDPFTQYDEKREKEAMRFLHEYAKDKQVILFTARPSEEPTLRL